jgi:Transposase DDE domain
MTEAASTSLTLPPWPFVAILVSRQHRVFTGRATRGKASVGWFYGFKLHLVALLVKCLFGNSLVIRAPSLNLWKIFVVVGLFWKNDSMFSANKNVAEKCRYIVKMN